MARSLRDLFISRRRSRRSRRPGCESLEDRRLLAPLMVTSTLDNGVAGTLRYAIEQADAASGNSIIDFNLPGTGPQTIDLSSPLPAITSPVTIDGTSQPGYSGTPVVVLNGSNAGADANGLTLSGGLDKVFGLEIINFQGSGIVLSGAPFDVIEGNVIGTDASGTTALGNGGSGIIDQGSLNATIGGTQPGLANVIAFNQKDGVNVYSSAGVGVEGVSIESNRIYGNGGLGIDIGGEGIATNSLGSAHNAPFLTSAVSTASGTVVTGTIVGQPNTFYQIQFYVNPTVDPSLTGQGRTLLGTTSVMTDSTGISAIDASLPVATTAGEIISATSTGIDSTTTFATTSSFAPDVVVVSAGSPPSFAAGDLVVGTQSLVQWRNSAGAIVGILNPNQGTTENTGMAFDSAGDLYVTNFTAGTVSKFNPQGELIGTFGSGYSGHPESIAFNSAGDVFVGSVDGDNKVREFSPSGTLIATFAPQVGDRGTDWIAIGPDQQTLYYTSEGTSIKRFDLATNTQLPDFADNLPGDHAFAIALLPGGGMLVADTQSILRLNAAGQIVQQYQVSGISSWYGLALDPGGNSFWAAATNATEQDFHTQPIMGSNVYHFDLATGKVIGQFDSSNTSPADTVFGLAVTPNPPTGAGSGSTTGTGSGSGSNPSIGGGTVAPIVVGTGTVSAYVDPRLIGVQEISKPMRPTELIASFSAPIDPTSASNAGYYTILAPGMCGRFGVPRERAIGAAIAIANSPTTVELFVRGRLNPRQFYELIVNGSGVRNASGTALDATGGGGAAGSGDSLVFGRGIGISQGLYMATFWAVAHPDTRDRLTTTELRGSGSFNRSHVMTTTDRNSIPRHEAAAIWFDANGRRKSSSRG